MPNEMRYATFRLEPIERKAENPAERYCDFDALPRTKRWQAEAAAQGATRLNSGGATRNLSDELRNNETLQNLIKTGRGTAVLKFNPGDLLTRTTITSAGVSVQPERMPGIIAEPRRQTRVQNMLTTVPVSSSLVEWVRVVSHAKVVSPQVEGDIKAENEITFERREEKVRTIATWLPASKQILEDFVGLEAFLRSSLIYALEEEFEDQILLGDGAGENLNGLLTQAATFNTGLLGTNWTRIDALGRAIQQLAMADQPAPDFVVLNPADYWSIRLSKDADGRYILGSPQGPAMQTLFDSLNVVQSTAISPGQFLLGSSNPNVVQLRMKQEATIEISTEHSDYFTRNLVAIRAELRAALVVMRPGAFIKGNLTSSPA